MSKSLFLPALPLLRRRHLKLREIENLLELEVNVTNSLLTFNPPGFAFPPLLRGDTGGISLAEDIFVTDNLKI